MTAETKSNLLLEPEGINLLPGDPFFELAQELSDLISRRAYELFESRGSVHGHDREDWLLAASEILLNVPLDVTQTDTELTIRADVPGFSEKDLEIRVAPRSVCISGKREDRSEQRQEDSVYTERRSNRIFRVLDLPSEVDPENVDATVSDGVLEVKLRKVGLGKKILVRAKSASA